MSYSVDETTQIATLDGVQYYPNCISDGVTTVFVALTEAECQSKKAEADAVPALNLEILRKTRNEKLAETDWEVVKPTELPPEPGPSQFHNDRFWDERSLDRELQDKDLQEEMIQKELESFNTAAERGEDFSRYNSNQVLDPYYQSGSDPSDPPSAGHSLDSFI